MHPTATAHTSLQRGKALLTLIRPRQWIKNSFVLAPLLFTGQFMSLPAVTSAVIAALLFCLASSAVYIVNDLHDIDKDRQHPVKAHKRPLANGTLEKRHAVALLALLYLLLAGAWYLGQQAVVAVAITYMLLNLAYSFWLKHQPVIDIFTIAIGFVLRVYAGAAALSVPLSSWMFVTTLCLALYLAAIKRRQELASNGDRSRNVLRYYSPELIDRYAEMSATGAVLFYSLFVMNTHPKLVVTIPLVLYGMFRYWFIVARNNAGESPTDALLSDWQLLATVALWGAASLFVLWPQP
ncbi:decaprenyl-phosphate phosphoribosyltransferase [Pseudomonas sp. KB-10]|uniref:decaprenyl-phosphate phosphoribosyltransferase n=1 Tax=Pseudomonas sp. KB-10 TaxID=2292264 RepID=UPI001BB04E14|nr:decaprenyl-phosphate phosphoribosyltransferase [Pseudomonas sp. KB-10]